MWCVIVFTLSNIYNVEGGGILTIVDREILQREFQKKKNTRRVVAPDWEY